MQKSVRRSVLVVEPKTSGHRLYYVRLLVEEILAQGQIAIVAGSKSARTTSEWAMHMGHLDGLIEFVEIVDNTSDEVSRTARQAAVQHVVVPDGDALAMELGWRRRWKSDATLSVLVMREPDQPSVVSGTKGGKGFVKTLLLHSATRLDRVKIYVLKSSLWKGKSRLSFVNDPVSLAADPRVLRRAGTSWKLSEEKYWFGIVGAITERKNIPMIVAALKQLDCRQIGLVVAGKISEGVKATLEIEDLKQFGLESVVHDRLLSDFELDSLVATLDCVVLAHSNEGSSGIMGKAAALGTRIVSAGALTLKVDACTIPNHAAWGPLTENDLTNLLSNSTYLGRPSPRSELSSRQFSTRLIC